LAVSRGGLGLSTVAQGDLLYGSAANTYSVLAKNTSSTRYLSNTGTSNNPAWAQVALATGVSGTLPGGNGGTGITSFGATGRIPFAASTTALTTSSNLTYTSGTNRLAAGSSSSVSAGADINGSILNTLASPVLVADLNQFRINGTPSTATNNIDYRSIYLPATITNDGTPTGGTYQGIFVENVIASPTRLSSNQGISVSLTSNSENNAGTMYGLRAAIRDNTTSSSLDNRTALSFDCDKGGDAVDMHTGRGIQARVRDVSSTGRWATGIGADLQVQQAQTATGASITISNSRGTANTQTGISIGNSVSGASTVVDNAYGLLLTHTESSSGTLTSYYGIISTSTPVATTTYGLYFSTAGWRNFLNGSLSLGVDATTAQLFVRGTGATSSTFSFITEKSDGTDTFKVRDDGVVYVGSGTPNGSAALEISSTTLGFKQPTHTTAQRDAVSAPIEGLSIYNSSTKGNDYYNGTR